jgi:hypothetical protein
LIASGTHRETARRVRLRTQNIPAVLEHFGTGPFVAKFADDEEAIAHGIMYVAT